MTTVLRTLPSSAPPIEHDLIREPGIYFNLPEAEYHSALALSASGIKNMRISTLDWWARSPLNPGRDDEETDALRIGKAYHKRIVEGNEAFHRSYVAELEIKDYRGALQTNEQLKAACAERGLKVGGTKGELIARLLAHDPTLEQAIWECIVEEHIGRHVGKERLPCDLIHKIEISAAMIEKHPQLGKAFAGGYPEVSIFWTDHESGVPCKARLDYLKPRAIVDLKTFENTLGMPVDKAIARAVASNKYHIQAAFYLEGVREAQSLIGEGRVFGEVSPDFLRALQVAEEQTFLFVFQQKGVAPLARGKVMPQGVTLDIGRLEIDQAKSAFARCWQAFGTDHWLDVSEVETFDSTEFPAFISD